MKKQKRRGRPTSYAFANNRHQRPAGILLFIGGKKFKRKLLKPLLERYVGVIK